MVVSSLIRPALVWLRRGSLDRRLATGTDPKTSPELARRARRLTSPRVRTGLAASIQNLLDAAEEPRRGLTSAVPIRRQAILAERELLLSLAAELEIQDDLQPKGIALLERLLTDGESPVYLEGNLHEELGRVRAALHLG